MNKSIDQTQAILIGGSSHPGKSTLGRALSAKHSVSKEEQHLIQKFLDRTLHYDRQMRAEIDRLGLMCIDVESISTADELFNSI